MIYEPEAHKNLTNKLMNFGKTSDLMPDFRAFRRKL